MTITDAMNYIYSEQFRRSCLGLNRMKDLMNRLSNPQDKLNIVHVTGTNGKGSTSKMLANILIQSKYKTGRFMSPFIENFNEQMSINNINISDDELIEIVEEIKPHIELMQEKPTEFELITAMAFLYFKNKGCDIVILEVGMGGRLDSTNIVSYSQVSVITNVTIDHSDFLGNTIEEITKEKMGIIKSNSVVVLGDQNSTVKNMVRDYANQLNTDFIITDNTKLERISNSLSFQKVNYRKRKNLVLSLLGSYQCNNLMVVLDVIDVLIKKGYNIPEEAIYNGLKTVHFTGRFEILKEKPLCILDGAHNVDAIKYFLESIDEYFPNKKVVFVIGVMKDKDYITMLKMMTPYAREFILVTPKNERSLSSDSLEYELEKLFTGKINNVNCVKKAMDEIMNKNYQENIYCILGTLYMMKEIKSYITIF